MIAIVKVMLSILVVLALAEISKRIHPQMAGVIAGLPLGTGLSVYFITLEQGVDFTVRGVPWGIAGLCSALFFCLMYLLVSKADLHSNRLVSITVTSVASIAAFLLFGSLLHSLRLTLFGAVVIFGFYFIINLWLIRRLIPQISQESKSKSSWKQYVSRGFVVGCILILITTVAPLAGSKWANLLSSFPSTVFPLLMILHYEDGARRFPKLIYGFSYSITTLCLFYLTYHYLIPIFGLHIGYLFIYILCTVYLVLVQYVKGYVGSKLGSKQMNH